MRPMPTAAADRWSSRAARATSSGRAAANHSRVKRPRASASGALKAPDFATSRDTRARREVREHFGHAPARGLRAPRPHPPGEDGCVHGEVPGDHAEDRKGEHVDAPGAVERGQRHPDEHGERHDDATRRSGTTGKIQHRFKEGMTRDHLCQQDPRALHARRRRIAGGATRFPRRGNAIGRWEERFHAVGLLDRLDQEDRTQLVFVHLPTVI